MNMKTTLQTDDKKRTFSNAENISIEEDKSFAVAQRTAEENWLEVNPLAIDQTLFKEKRKDKKQEETRRLILEAFEELKNNPEEYGKNFKTMMPEKTWKEVTVRQLKELACKLGDHMANWVEQALEWAQRIANGESWEDVCNERDTANWYRAVIWKSSYTVIVGGSARDRSPSSFVSIYGYRDYEYIRCTVPLVVLYEQ